MREPVVGLARAKAHSASAELLVPEELDFRRVHLHPVEHAGEHVKGGLRSPSVRLDVVALGDGVLFVVGLLYEGHQRTTSRVALNLALSHHARERGDDAREVGVGRSNLPVPDGIDGCQVAGWNGLRLPGLSDDDLRGLVVLNLHRGLKSLRPLVLNALEALSGCSKHEALGFEATLFIDLLTVGRESVANREGLADIGDGRVSSLRRTKFLVIHFPQSPSRHCRRRKYRSRSSP